MGTSELEFEIFVYGFQVKFALPALEWLLHIQDDEVLADACWALLYISDGPNDNV